MSRVHTNHSRSKETQHSIKPVFLEKDPFRFVKKYQYKFDTYCKKRWIGKKLLDVLQTEFSAFSESYYKKAIEQGNIKINKQIVDIEYILQNSDFIEHMTIRLEPPTLNITPNIVYEDEELIVVDKPPSFLVHAGAGSNFNTLQGVLIHILDQPANISFIHRLDKYTSGLVMISKKKIDSYGYHNKTIEEKSKIYLARVHGNFPDESPLTVDKALYCDDQKLFHFNVCEKKDEERLKAKQSETVFKKLWYDKNSDTSLVECQPLTGRTHQIRVHLSSLGFPIVNDAHYGGKFIGNYIIKEFWPEIWQNSDIKSVKYTDADPESLEEFSNVSAAQNQENKSDDIFKTVLEGYQTQQQTASIQAQQYENLIKKQKLEENQEKTTGDKQETSQQLENTNTNTKIGNKIENKEEFKIENIKQYNKDLLNSTNNTEQNEKQEQEKGKQQQEEEKIPKDTDRKNESIEWNFRDHVMEIYLHSYRYKFNGKEFQTNPPYWAKESFTF